MPPEFNLLSFFKAIPNVYKYGGMAVVALALVSGIYYKGYSSGKEKGLEQVAAFVAKSATQQLAIQRAQNTIAQLSVENLLKKVDTIHVRGTKNVAIASTVPDPVIITVHDTVRVELSLGWVSVYSASARGFDADTADSSNGTASGITANDALRHTVQNFTVCRENAARLDALQNWIKQTQKSIDSVKVP